MVAKNLQRILGGAALASSILGNSACSSRYMSIHDKCDETIVEYEGRKIAVVDSDFGPMVLGDVKRVARTGERRALVVEPLTEAENTEVRNYLIANHLAGF